jgi:hypothetical protein
MPALGQPFKVRSVNMALSPKQPGHQLMLLFVILKMQLIEEAFRLVFKFAITEFYSFGENIINMKN